MNGFMLVTVVPMFSMSRMFSRAYDALGDALFPFENQTQQNLFQLRFTEVTDRAQ